MKTPDPNSSIPSHLDIENKTKQFLGVLEAREVGLFSWVEARTKLAEELYAMLGKVLGKNA